MADPTTTLRVDFVSESAAYANTFGWYNSVTGMGGILFADVDAGPLTPGVSSATFTVKTSDLPNIQFFLVPDGYDLNRNDADDLTGAIKVIRLADGSWAVADVDAYGNVITRYHSPDILEGAGANALFTETSKNAGGVDYASSVAGSNQTAATLAGDTADGVTGTIAWEDLAATRNWNGTYSRPGDADYNDAVFRVSIVGGNHAPVAVNDVASATEAGGVNNATPGVNPAGNVLTNDTDIDPSDTKTVTTVGVFAGAHGTLTLNADGSYLYAVNNSDAAVQALRTASDTLADTFSYTMRDTAGATSSATLTVTIHGANDAPVAVNDAASASEAGGVNNATPGVDPTGNVLANDTDVDAGDSKTVTTVGAFAGAHGTLTLNADGSYSYAVNNSDAAVEALRTAANTLTDTFSYTMRDTAGATSSAALTVTIHGANDAPVAVADSNGSDAVVESGVNPGNTPFAGDPSAAGNVLANDTDVDAGDSRSVTTTGDFTGTYGTLHLNADGSYTYTLNNADPDTNALAQGESASDVFNYTIADGQGATASSTLTINLTGTNDAPVITGGTTTGSVTEDAAITTATGTITVVDPDHGAQQFWTVVGGLPSGSANYHFLMDSLTITRFGSPFFTDDFSDGNPPPSAPSNTVSNGYGGVGSFTESGGKLHLDSNTAGSFVGVGTSDPIIGEDALLRTNIDPASPNGLKLSATFNVTGVFDLVLPDSPREEYGIRLMDRLIGGTGTPPDQPGDDTASLTVRENIAGNLVVSLRKIDFQHDMITNLASLALAPPVGADQIALHLNHNANDTFVTASFDYLHLGTVIGTQTFATTAPLFNNENWTRADIVADAPAINDSAFGGTYGTLNVSQSGSWTYTLDNARAATQALAQGQHASDTFTVQVADQFGATSSTPVTITVTGTNDTPFMQTGPVSRSVTEDNDVDANGKLTAAGSAQFSDVDLTDVHHASVQLTSTAGFVQPALMPLLNTALTALVEPEGGDGHGQVDWNFALDNNAVQYLAQGQTLTLDYHVIVTDPFGASAFEDVTVTINGINDAPVVDPADKAESASFGENPGVTGDLTNHHAGGQIHFSDPDLADHLTASLLSQTWTYTAADGHTALPLLPGQISALLGDFQVSNIPGTPNPGFASWTFDAVDQQFDYLAQGETLTLTSNLQVADGNSGLDNASVTVTINGANDAPVAVADSGAVVEAGVDPGNNPFAGTPSATGNVLANDTDVDLSDTHSVVTAGIFTGTYGTLALAADGSYTYTLDNADPDTQALAQGELASDTFSYTMRDNIGATASSTLTINLTGTNDAPTVSGDRTASFTEDTLPAWISGQLTATDVDHGATQTWSIAHGIPAQQDYNFALDEFKITRNGNPFFDDTFSDGAAPPSAPNIIGGGPVSYGVGPTGAAFFESDGRALLVGAPNGALSPVAINGFASVGQSATLQTDNTNNLNGVGLKKDMTFTVDGRFDLAIPTDVRDQYGIRLSDNTSANTGDNTVSLSVRRDADGVHVTLSELNFSTSSAVVLQQINLNPAPGDDQIVLHLNHPTANATDVTASFDLLDNGVVTSTTNFTNMAHAFDNENWVQAQFLANGLPETDSVLQGTYSTLTVDQNGEWTARIRNGQAAVQALAKDETVTETFNVQVTDDHGAVTTQPVTVSITGTNDAPVISGTSTGSVTEDAPNNQVTGQLTATDVDHGATQTWTVMGGTPGGNANYHFLADEFIVTKVPSTGLITVLDDGFSDGNPPPNSPPLNPGQPNQQNTTYAGIGGFTESGGKLFLDSNNAVSFVGVGTPDPFIGQDAIVRTNIDPANTTLGLKQNATFTITGVFDLVLPDSPRETYGVRFTDRLVGGGGTPPDQQGNNVVELVVREAVNGNLVVALRNLDFQTNVTTNLQSLGLTPPPGADQIVLVLNHNANDAFATASFQYINHANPSAILGSQSFSTHAPIFQGENWGRAELVAYAPQFTDSLKAGTYGTLDIGQSGAWTYSLNNNLATTQALAQGQHATDTFTVQVADQFGAFDTRVINIDVVGSNDAPIMQTGPVSRTLPEDSDPLALTATGLAQFSDADLTDTHIVSATMQPATLSTGAPLPVGLPFLLPNAMTVSLNPETGDGHGQVQWNFNLANSLTQFLAQGETLTIDYHVNVLDQFSSTFQDVTINVTGVNDAPVILGPSNIDLGSLIPGNGPTSGLPLAELANNFSFTDADYSDHHIVGASFDPLLSSPGAPLGSMTATLESDPTLGVGGLVHWSYLFDPNVLNALPANTVRHETYDVTINDGHGGIATEHVTVNIGAVTPPPISGATFVTLDNPGAIRTLAFDINDYGEIVGQTATSSSSYFSFDYQGGTFSAIAYPATHNTSANTINNNGLVGGYDEPGSSTPRYGFTESNGSYSAQINLSAAQSTTVDGINDAGTYVGSSYLGGPNFQGFIVQAGVPTFLTVPGASTTSANGINNANDVVGSYFAGGHTHGFISHAGSGIYVTVDDPLGVDTVAADINDAGQIVGWYNDAGGHTYGFVDSGGVFATIDDPLGVNGTFVRGINNMGQVVGWYTDGSNVSHGFVASINGGNIFMGTPNNDTLNGTAAGDLVLALPSNDIITGGLGNDVVDGGAGTDMMVYSTPKSVYTITPFAGHVLVNGPDGSDRLTGVELIQFADVYQMVSNTADISQVDPFHIFTFTLAGFNPIYGTDGGDFLTVGTNVNFHPIDLGAGLDNLFLNQPGFRTFDLNLTNVEQVYGLSGDGETVNLLNPQNGLLIDLGDGFDTLNLANGTNVITAAQIETIHGGTGDDTVTFTENFLNSNQVIDLGGGTNTLNLATGGDYVFSVSGDNLTVHGTAADEHITLLNVQAGTTFDLGSGVESPTPLTSSNNTLQLWDDFASVNVVSVRNVDHVIGTNSSDQITLLGNDGYQASGVTTVDGHGGADYFNLSAYPFAQAAVFHYGSLSDSPAGGAGRDTIDGFDSNWDIIDLRGLGIDHWEVGNVGGADVFQAFLSTDSTNLALEIALPNFHGLPLNHDLAHLNVLI